MFLHISQRHSVGLIYTLQDYAQSLLENQDIMVSLLLT